MGADFKPELAALNEIKPFVFWAQTTLPTVFDDALSYYEVLAKLCKMVNTLLENADTTAHNVDALAHAYGQLQDYVNEYFLHLDISDELDALLQSLKDDGTIERYVEDYAEPVVHDYLYGASGEGGVNKDIEDMLADMSNALAEFGLDSADAIETFNSNGGTAILNFQHDCNDAFDEFESATTAKLNTIPTTVDLWLTQHFYNPTNVVLDGTLSIAGTAGESSAVGRAIDSVKNLAIANTSVWNNVYEVITGKCVLVDTDGTNARVANDYGNYRPMYVAPVTGGSGYYITCVGSLAGGSYTPCYALANITYDVNNEPVYTILDTNPRSWADDTIAYEYVRDYYITIPETIGNTTVNAMLLGSNTEVAITTSCSQLAVKTDNSLTSHILPAEGAAVGTALDAKVPWPLDEGTKDTGNEGQFLISNGDGTTSWSDGPSNYDEAIAELQDEIDGLDNDISNVEDSVSDVIYNSTITGSFDYSNVPEDDMINIGISPGGVWTSSFRQRSYTYKIPSGVTKLTVTANANGSIIAFLNSYTTPVVGEHPDFSTEYDARIVMSANTSTTYEVAGDMNYMFCLCIDTSGNDKKPGVFVESFGCDLDSVDSEVADESAVHDRKSEIFFMLNSFGSCRLNKGVFYVSENLTMPGGTTLEGFGFLSVLKLLASVEEGSTVKMGTHCTIKNLYIKGGSSTQWGLEAQGRRYGIEWTGGDELYSGRIENCNVLYFSGAGLYIHDTTQKTYRGLHISDCYVRNNYVGIDIRKNSEFNKIVNCNITSNAIGFRNRGGNNVICNSGVDANKLGIQIDSDEGTNGGHGSICNCTINHSNSNTGYGIVIKDTGRMLIDNCNVYYSKIKLENTNGNVISNCGFGNSADWEISGGECSMFVGCMVRGWDSGNSLVTITNNTALKIVNCYDRNGNPYTPSP